MRKPALSLRFRLFLMTAGVAVAAVVSVGWYAGRLGERALDGLRPGSAGDLAPLAARLRGLDGDWTRAEPLLRAEASRRGEQLLVIDRQGRRVLAASPEVARLGVEVLPDGALSWEAVVEERGGPPRVQHKQRVMVASPPSAPIDERAALVAVPASLAERRPAAATALRRSLLVGALVAVVGAVLAALLLSLRVAAPVERLTAAVREAAARRDPADPVTVAPSGARELAELARAFNALLAELARIEALRRGMTSDIAHELRTPVTNLRCHIESLQDGLEQPTAATYASLHEETMTLQRLIEDLRDISLGDQGQLRLAIEPVDVAAELEAALRPYRARAAAADTTLRLDARADLPRVAGDPVRFRQIVGNLLTNALTHTPAGGTIEVSASSSAGDQVVVRVRDTGRGIDPRDAANVFERFYRADPARARSGGGAGLGLAIVKQLVAAQGGRVWLDSRPGEGTTVSFTCPSARG